MNEEMDTADLVSYLVELVEKREIPPDKMTHVCLFVSCWLAIKSNVDKASMVDLLERRYRHLLINMEKMIEHNGEEIFLGETISE
tara:strand:+ start:520 stop:774 length:255 start_codon:yes stop_codon:yes gene_type:complete